MWIERKKYLYLFFLISWVASALFLACDAPRNNPLDPANPQHELGELSGYTKSVRAPHPPISGVHISIPQQNLYTSSDKDGFFEFSRLFEPVTSIIASKSGFVNDTLDVQAGRVQHLEILLNQIPVIQTFTVNTLVINQYPDWQFFYLQIIAAIEDKDMDTDSVWFELPALSIAYDLPFNPSLKQYQVQLSSTDLGVKTLKVYMGKEFSLHVRDMSQQEFILGSTRISRIIEEQVQLKSPANYALVDHQPFLQWQRFDPGYKCSYTIEVYTDTFFPALVWQRKNLSQETLETTVNESLQNGEYFWVVWCVDEFGNRSRSKPASFIVQ